MSNEEVTQSENNNDEQALNEINAEIDKKLVESVDSIINPKSEEVSDSVNEVEKSEFKRQNPKDDQINPETGEVILDKKEDKTKEKPAEVSAEDTNEDGEEVDADDSKDGEKDASKEDSDKTTPNLSDLNLPHRLLQAAKRNQLTDEEILKLGDEATPILEKLADRLDSVSTILGDVGRQRKQQLSNEKKELPKEIPTLKIEKEAIEENASLKAIQDSYNVLVSEVTTLRQQLVEKEVARIAIDAQELDRRVDTFFDSKGKEYPELGLSSKLGEIELGLRKKIFSNADDILVGAEVRGEKLSVEDALALAFSIYEGQNPTKVKERILKEVENREKQLISRSRSKKNPVKRTGENRAVQAVNEFFQRQEDGWTN